MWSAKDLTLIQEILMGDWRANRGRDEYERLRRPMYPRSRRCVFLPLAQAKRHPFWMALGEHALGTKWEKGVWRFTSHLSRAQPVGILLTYNSRITFSYQSSNTPVDLRTLP